MHISEWGLLQKMLALKATKTPDLPRKKWSLKNNFDARVFSNETWHLETIVFTEPKYLGIGRFRPLVCGGVSSTIKLSYSMCSTQLQDGKPQAIWSSKNWEHKKTSNQKTFREKTYPTTQPLTPSKQRNVQRFFLGNLGLFTSTTPLPLNPLLPRYCCSPR